MQLTLAVSVLAIFAIAQASESMAPTADAPEKPTEVLEGMIQSDFAGSSVGRHGLVYFSREDSERDASCDCSSPRDSFDIRSDPVVIVSSLGHIKDNQIRGSVATFEVEFDVLAVTVGEGDDVDAGKARRIVPLKVHALRTSRYRLIRKEGKWYVLDSPPPRVGLQSLLSALQDEVGAFERIREPTRQQSDQLEWLNKQVGVAKSLKR